MSNYDGTGVVSFSRFMFFYDKNTKNWKSDNAQGRKGNIKTETIGQNFACHFTNAQYVNYETLGDRDLDFGLLSGKDKEKVADCVLTIVK
jgi:hypothetical protein